MRVSAKAERFTESVIREMTRIARQHNSINLAQGFPDFDTPAEVVDAAVDALQSGHNQYAITWGTKNLRDSISYYFKRWYGMEVDPEREITVTCGSTEAMISSVLATVNPGDEIIILEPFYENYGPDAILSGAVPKFVPMTLTGNGWQINWKELELAFNPDTAAIILNTPNNPTGKVLSRDELSRIAQLCITYDALCITDEIYDHIVFDGLKHVPPATLPGMKERTVTINAMSKTFAVTGWRVGWAVASPEITGAIRKVHDFVTVGAPHPLQEAGAKALRLPDDYFHSLAPFYQERRDFTEQMLTDAGFITARPGGAYYTMADIGPFGWDDDTEFSRWLAAEIGVAVVPGSSFFSNSDYGRRWVRFCFCKTFETLKAARERLLKLKGHKRQV